MDTTLLDFADLNHDHHNFDFSIVDFLNDPFNLNPFDPTQFPTHPVFPTSEASHASSNPYAFLNNNSSDIFQTLPHASSFLKVDESHESNGSNKVLMEESQGSPTFDNNNDNNNNTIKNGVVDLCFNNLDGYVKDEANYVNGLLKRNTYNEDSSNSDTNTNSNKRRKSSDDGCNVNEEEKRKARLEKNRESAQLSRQRKKHYLVELEDKVRIMHSTIQDLNAKISYVIAENSSLREQMGGGGVVPSPVAGDVEHHQQPRGMYPPPSMMFPWMPASPYMVKAEGSRVPLVPIPRLKSPVPRTSKKTENRRSGGRTKKVASVSFAGLLFFMLLFGGLVPMVNVRYGGMKDSYLDRSDFVCNRKYEKHNGKVLIVNGSGYDETFSKAPDINRKINGAPVDDSVGDDPRGKHGRYEFVGEENESEPLMASLYVPRNDKLVKIDGNLIIHSVLASEKATTQEDEQEKNNQTGLAIPGRLAPSEHRRNAGRLPPVSLGSSVATENLKATEADQQLHQWFREGLAGPMLSSGKCTEVFQFDVVSASASGAIDPATSGRNISTSSKNSTNVRQGLNRRILHGLPFPLPGSPVNNLTEKITGRETGKADLAGTNSSSSMVVSILLDPLEAADAESGSAMGPKSGSRIFVVVLVDGVKYVTYSCRFPFKGEAVPHLVTT